MITVSVFGSHSFGPCSFLSMEELRKTPRWRHSACTGHSFSRGLQRAKNLRRNRILDSFSKSSQMLQFPLGSCSVPTFVKFDVSFMCYAPLFQIKEKGDYCFDVPAHPEIDSCHKSENCKQQIFLFIEEDSVRHLSLVLNDVSIDGEIG